MAKVLWIQNVWIEYMGIMSISAQLKRQGHESEVIFDTKEEVVKHIKKFEPSVIAFSLMSVQWNWAKEMTTFIKNHGIETPIIVGGVHSTLFPEETISHPAVDVCCLHEGEYPMLEFVQAIDEARDYSQIQNLWVRKDATVFRNPTRPKMSAQEVDGLVYPDRDIYKKYEYFKKYPFEIFIGSRGCPFACAFCEIPQINKMYGGKRIVYRDPFKFVDEIEEAKNSGLLNNKLVMFIDSVFNPNKKWFLSFLEEYRKRINLPFTCNLRADVVDEEQIQALALSNCDSVRFGVESGDSDIRNKILNKNLTDEKIMYVSQLLHKYKIRFMTFNVFGCPGETLEQAWATIHMNQAIKPHAIGNYILVLYPKLGITNYALFKGLISENDLAKLGRHPYNIYLSILRQRDIKEVCNLHKFSILLIKYPIWEGIVRRLVHLPPNGVFNLIYSISQALEFRKWSSRSSIPKILYEAVLNYQALGLGDGNSKGILNTLSNVLAGKVSRGVDQGKKPC